ncbi:AI-2E family transporter [Paenibacillus sp. M1]|uniref:AI-2E family transporter n=1 Tax=Paenibacillus haidiansis TaxID=1574488 RepID=A0ABU7VXE1_9BACL
MARLNLFIRICLAILLVLGIIFLGSKVNFIFTPILSLFSIIIIPLMLAGFFYYLLRPLINWLERKKLNRTLAILLVYLVILVLLTGFIAGIWPSLRTQLVNLVNNAPSLFAALNDELVKLADSPWFSSLFPAESNPFAKITEYLNKGFSLLINYVTGLFSFVSDFAIILFTFPIMLYYMLKEGGKFGRRIVSLFPSRYRQEGNTIVAEIDDALSNFIVGRVIVNLALGVLMYVGFLIIGLPYALLLTVIAVIMNFIPFIGAILSSVPIFIIGLIESPSTAVWSIIVVLAAQQIQDNLIAPYIFGKKLDIHPLTTIILVLLGGDLWGIIGILLIIPVYLILKIIVSKFYDTYLKSKQPKEEPSLEANPAEENKEDGPE